MTNPYPKPIAGTGKILLKQGFKLTGRNEQSEQIEKGNLSLAIVFTITGNVKTFPNLISECVRALKALNQTDDTKHYIFGLENGIFIPASPNGAYVYKDGDKEAEAYVKERIESENNQIFQSGELYFKS